MARSGVSLTYLAFVAAATVEALEEFPILNASIEGDEIVYHDDVNLGIAVALDDGLIVPVIRQAQRLSLEGLAAVDRRPRRAGAQRSGSSPTRSTAARSRSPTPGSSARCSRRRSSTSRRWRSSTSRRSSSGRSWSTDEAGRLDRDPADDLPAHVVGPPGARRRRRGEVPRRGQGPARGWEAELMAIAIRRRRTATARRRGDRRRDRAGGARPRAGRGPARRALGPLRVVAVHSTALGPALGGAADVALPRRRATRSRDALRLAAGMTLKAAAAGLDLGGGKGVICAPPEGLDGERRRGGAARLRRPGRVARRPLHHRRGRRHRARGPDRGRRAHLARHRPAARPAAARATRARSPRSGSRRRSARARASASAIERPGRPQRLRGRARPRRRAARAAPRRRRLRAARLRHRPRPSGRWRDALGADLAASPSDAMLARLRRARAVRARRRDHADNVGAAPLRGRLRLGEQPARRRLAGRACSPSAGSSTRPTSSPTRAA